MPTAPFETRLDQLHASVRAVPLMRAFAVACRLLLALAFLPSGWKKLAGQRFTQIPVEHPIGFFFEALYQSGPYYRFIGLAQVVAAILLLIPRTATLGAWLFLPIVANVAVVTVSLHFTGTAFITVPMLLASLYLVLWDYDRFKPILGSAFGWSMGSAAGRPSPAEAFTAASFVLVAGAAAELVWAAALMLWEPQRPPFAAPDVLAMAWALAPLAAWAFVVRRARHDERAAGRAVWVSAALLGLALATGVAWAAFHQTAGVADVLAYPPLALWATALVGAVWVRPRRAALATA